jgi:RNase P subunit RPR2
MVETSLSVRNERGYIALECQDCGDTGHIEYIKREENPWENPSVQEAVSNLRIKEIRWQNCDRCDGNGWVPDGICDLRRAENGRENPCPKCHTSGRIPRVVETDGGVHFLDGNARPTYREQGAKFVPLLGVVETVHHFYWNDVADWRIFHHAESHVSAEGYNV